MLWMLAAAASLAAMLVLAHVNGDYDPSRRSYAANFPGDLGRSLSMGAYEVVLLTVLLRPWSYHRSVGRAVLALVLWLPWTLFAAMVCMHCGPIGGAHVLWRLIVVAGLFAAVIVSAVARRRAGRAS